MCTHVEQHLLLQRAWGLFARQVALLQLVAGCCSSTCRQAIALYAQQAAPALLQPALTALAGFMGLLPAWLCACSTMCCGTATSTCRHQQLCQEILIAGRELGSWWRWHHTARSCMLHGVKLCWLQLQAILVVMLLHVCGTWVFCAFSPQQLPKVGSPMLVLLVLLRQHLG